MNALLKPSLFSNKTLMSAPVLACHHMHPGTLWTHRTLRTNAPSESCHDVNYLKALKLSFTLGSLAVLSRPDSKNALQPLLCDSSNLEELVGHRGQRDSPQQPQWIHRWMSDTACFTVEYCFGIFNTMRDGMVVILRFIYLLETQKHLAMLWIIQIKHVMSL